MKPRYLFALLLTGLAFSANAEQINKWVDAEGKVHYSNQPPPAQVKSKVLDIKTQPLSGEEKSTTPNTADKEMESRKRKAAEAEAKAKQEKTAAETRQKEQNCNNARNNLRSLQESGRIVQYNAAGEREIMDDGARQQAISEAQNSVDAWCK